MVSFNRLSLKMIHKSLLSRKLSPRSLSILRMILKSLLQNSWRFSPLMLTLILTFNKRTLNFHLLKLLPVNHLNLNLREWRTKLVYLSTPVPLVTKLLLSNIFSKSLRPWVRVSNHTLLLFYQFLKLIWVTSLEPSERLFSRPSNICSLLKENQLTLPSSRNFMDS